MKGLYGLMLMSGAIILRSQCIEAQSEDVSSIILFIYLKSHFIYSIITSQVASENYKFHLFVINITSISFAIITD